MVITIILPLNKKYNKMLLALPRAAEGGWFPGSGALGSTQETLEHQNTGEPGSEVLLDSPRECRNYICIYIEIEEN